MRVIFKIVAGCLFLASSAFAQTRQVVITYLSWYQPYGTVVGCNQWRTGGAGYVGSANSLQNRPSRSQASAPSPNSSPISFALSPMGARYIRSELTAIKESGFDVVAYDMLPDPRPQAPAIPNPAYCGLNLFERYGEIANELGLKVTLFSDIKNRSADYPQEYVFNRSEWLSAYSTVIKNYGSRDWFWRPRNVPALFQFGATVGAMRGVTGGKAIAEWKAISDQLAADRLAADIFLDVRPADRQQNIAGKSNLLPFIFAPGAPYIFLNGFMKELSQVTDVPVWMVSPGYYRRSLRAHLPPDFSRIHSAYQAAMEANAQVMLVATWNDFEEDTDIVPSNDKGNSLLAIFSYYNDWFKTNTQPVIEHSFAVISTPKARFQEVKSFPPKWGQGDKEGEGTLQGKIGYYWAALKESGSISINGNRIVLAKGISFGRVPIGSASTIDITSSFSGPAKVDVLDSQSEGDSVHSLGRTYNYILMKE